MDWADEIAKVFLDGIDANDLDDVSGPASPYTRLATVLRKSRAVGMRMYAHYACDEHQAFIIEQANKIEKGEA